MLSLLQFDRSALEVFLNALGPGGDGYLSAVLVFCRFFLYYLNPSNKLFLHGAFRTDHYLKLRGVLRSVA